MEPAHKAGLDIEDGLVEVLLADMRPYGAAGLGAGGHEAGALPLLSHALLATWEHSRGGRLTVADYQASGGIRDAITRTAEHAYATLGAGEQDVARQLFLRLVHIGDDGRETRARLPRTDLPGDATVAAAVLERFVGQRLITMDRDEAEITHEALLGAWPRLRAWTDADREDIRIRRSITVAAQAWAAAGREPAALLRGGQLALARDWAATGGNRAALSRLGQDFVKAGIAEERAQRAAGRRRTRRLRQLVAALTAVVVVAVALAGYAFRQRQIATGYGDGDIQLWRRGARLVPLGTPRAASRAGRAAGGNAVEFVAFRPGGDILASAADDGTVRLWNVANPAKPALVSTLHASADAVFSVAFGSGGRLLAASSADDKVRLWNVANPAAPVQLGKALTGPAKTAYSVAFSPRGHLLAVGSADRDVRLWDISDPARPHRIGPVLAGPSGYVYSVAFGPGGRVLAAGNTDGSVWLWNLADPAHPGLIATLTGPTGHVFSVGFGHGGRTVAAADSSGLVWLWNTQASAAARGVCAMAGQPLTTAEWHVYVPGLPYAPPCRLFRLCRTGPSRECLTPRRLPVSCAR